MNVMVATMQLWCPQTKRHILWCGKNKNQKIEVDHVFSKIVDISLNFECLMMMVGK